MQKLWIAMIALALAAPFSAFSQEKGDMGTMGSMENMGDSGQMKKEHKRKGKRMGRRHRRGGCKLAERVARKRGDKCLRVKKDNKRKRCMDRVGNYLERKFGERCMSQLEPIRRDLERRESEKYGKNSFGDMKGDHRGNDHMKGSMGSAQGSGKGHDPMMSPQRDDKPPHRKFRKDHRKGPNCNKIADKVRKKADKCLSRKNERKRRRCFDNIGRYMERSGGERCHAQLEPMREQFMAREREKFPEQGQTLKDDGPRKEPHHMGSQDQGKGHHGMDKRHDKMKRHKKAAKACRKVADRARKKGDRCLGKRSQGKRRSCFDKIGSYVRKAKGGRCEGALEPMKERFMEEERRRYPKQESGIL